MTVKECGFIIDGVKYVCNLNSTITKTIIRDIHSVVGYIIGEDDTYIQSNTYLTR